MAKSNFVVSRQIKFLKVYFTMFVLFLSNNIVGKMSIYKKGIRGTCKYIRETCSSVLLCQGNQVTIYNTITGERLNAAKHNNVRECRAVSLRMPHHDSEFPDRRLCVHESCPGTHQRNRGLQPRKQGIHHNLTGTAHLLYSGPAWTQYNCMQHQRNSILKYLGIYLISLHS